MAKSKPTSSSKATSKKNANNTNHSQSTLNQKQQKNHRGNSGNNSVSSRKWYRSLDQFITETNQMLKLEKEAEEMEASSSMHRTRYIELMDVQSTLNGKYMVQFRYRESSTSHYTCLKSGQAIQIRMINNNNNNNNNSGSDSGNSSGNSNQGITGIITTNSTMFTGGDDARSKDTTTTTTTTTATTNTTTSSSTSTSKTANKKKGNSGSNSSKKKNATTTSSSSSSTNTNSNSNNNNSNSSNSSSGNVQCAIMDDFQEEMWQESKLQLITVPDDVTHKRYMFTLNQKLPQNEHHPIVRACFCDDDDDDSNGDTSSSMKSSSSSIFDDMESDDDDDENDMDDDDDQTIQFMNRDLNQEQKRIVRWCFSQHSHHNNKPSSHAQAQSSLPIQCILGPPGTGKSTTLIEIIQQAVSIHRLKVLVCAPSNTAVDNLVIRLSRASRSNNKLKNKIRMIRLGHPARLHDDVTRESLDYVLSHGDSARIMNEMRSEMRQILRTLASSHRGNRSRGSGSGGGDNSSSGSGSSGGSSGNRESRRELYEQLKYLRKDLKRREKELVREELRHAQVILCTLTGADDYQLFKSNVQFDLVVIDEAAQSIEVANWIALLKGQRAILAGDPFQLPATVLSPEAMQQGLGITLFERLYHRYGARVTRMLRTQYRMHREIMQWSSDEFYGGKLRPGSETIAQHLLCHLPLNSSNGSNGSGSDGILDDIDDNNNSGDGGGGSGSGGDRVEEIDETATPLFMIDTSSCGMNESVIEQGESSYNMHEVALVKQHVKTLSDAGVKDYQISVISPYMAQVIALRDALSDEHPFVEVNTVDGFQGRENECVIISMVRSNSQGEVGFLADERRTNVAITRAKRHVCIVCDTTTLRTDPFLSRMASYFSDNADVRSAEDYDV